MTVLLLAAVLPWILIGFGCWFCYQLVRQNGRILLRLEALEKRLEAQEAEPPSPTPAPPSGLPVGSIAPEFELPDLAGTRHRLSDFRGRSVLLIFFNPNCGFCTAMASDLAALVPRGGEGQAVPLVVTTGDAQANRQLFQKHEIRCPVLLQKDMEVASQYQAHGTPMGYLIDEKGTIASNLTAGAPALLASAQSATPEEPKAQQKPKAKGNRPVS